MSLENTYKHLPSENSQSQKPTQYLIPWMGNVQEQQIHNDCLHPGGGTVQWEVDPNGYRVWGGCVDLSFPFGCTSQHAEVP